MIITVKKVPFNDDAIAATIGPIVFVEKGAVDKGVIEHEKFHARMFYYWNAPTAVLALVAWVHRLYQRLVRNSACICRLCTPCGCIQFH